MNSSVVHIYLVTILGGYNINNTFVTALLGQKKSNVGNVINQVKCFLCKLRPTIKAIFSVRCMTFLNSS